MLAVATGSTTLLRFEAMYGSTRIPDRAVLVIHNAAKGIQMKFGIFYELQLPRPWGPDDERQLVQDALLQVELADRLGIDYAWAVEHHFLEEYSHCSASEVFLAAVAARTKRIRLGHGIRQVIANYNHPARTAEAIAMLDLVSNGRTEFGIGEGATRLELGGFGIPAKEKRAMALEAAEQIANMMVMEPYPGFEGRSFKMPCRNVIPKPVQKPHPPMWMACTNRDTIKVAASLGLGALAFSFINEAEARTWSRIYYDIIRSDGCVPLGHSVNANIAMVSAFSLHEDPAEAERRGQEGFEFFRYAISALVTQDTVPGRSQLFRRFRRERSAGTLGTDLVAGTESLAAAFQRSRGIGTPDDFRTHVRSFEAAGVDQIILLQQAGRNRHEHICRSMELLGRDVLPEFAAKSPDREKRKEEELAPYVEKALTRKTRMAPLADNEIPVVRASVTQPIVNRAAG
jgi:alkanesulfonate monooxygenase SsuD/methylene tetrahydromethanopterin reductase-like flavin-dependent oxidoreductase (luciferase family)